MFVGKRGRRHASERFVRFERNREGAFFHSLPNTRRKKKAVLVLLKKRVDAKSDAAFLSNHLPPLVYSLRFQTPAATDANYAQTNSPHNSPPMDGANFHLPLISSGESETAAIPTSLSVQRHNDRGEESEAAPHTYFGPMDGELSEGGSTGRYNGGQWRRRQICRGKGGK